MNPLDVLRTASFRTSALASLVFGTGTLLLFAFLYWQTAGWETERINGFLVHESTAIEREPSDSIVRDVSLRFAHDLHRQSFAAVFTSALAPIAGDLAAFPEGLAPDGIVHDAVAARIGPNGATREDVRAIARHLRDGRILVVGRSVQDLTKLRQVVLRALELGLLPGLLLALGVGTFASMRSLNKVRRINDSIARIMQGDLRERLESHDTGEILDQLSVGVNRMLDEIERLVQEVQGVGDDVAHDLRTPLTRMRSRLERGRATAPTREALQDVVDLAITDLDQALGMMTALLRIGQIEAGARRAGFAQARLKDIAQEAGDFYRPLADLRGVALRIETACDGPVWGDRDLLFEVAVNLVDNAIKFTPPDGTVTIGVRQEAAGSVLWVRDSGPGVPAHERALVLKRFHRGDRSRHIPGTGLGLSLVAAIIRLHTYHLHLDDGAPGLLIEMRCWPDNAG